MNKNLSSKCYFLNEANIDRSLVFLEKPKEKLLNKNIKIYHGSNTVIDSKFIKPLGPNVGATYLSSPRWSTYVWDNKDYAIKWSIFRVIRGLTDALFRLDDTILVLQKDEVYDYIKNNKVYGYVYESTININRLEVGSSPSAPEYTISDDIEIEKVYKIPITEITLDKYCEFIENKEEFESHTKEIINIKNRRSKLLEIILKPDRDVYRYIIRKDLKKGVITHDDDIKSYKKIINKSWKNDTLNLREDSLD